LSPRVGGVGHDEDAAILSGRPHGPGGRCGRQAAPSERSLGRSLEPRLEKVPVRLPLPPALHQGSIYENQRAMKAAAREPAMAM
jgi:hypothetical protein